MSKFKKKKSYVPPSQETKTNVKKYTLTPQKEHLDKGAGLYKWISVYSNLRLFQKYFPGPFPVLRWRGTLSSQ